MLRKPPDSGGQWHGDPDRTAVVDGWQGDTRVDRLGNSSAPRWQPLAVCSGGSTSRSSRKHPSVASPTRSGPRTGSSPATPRALTCEGLRPGRRSPVAFEVYSWLGQGLPARPSRGGGPAVLRQRRGSVKMSTRPRTLSAESPYVVYRGCPREPGTVSRGH